ncbi:MAG: large subunit ribosomal protein L32e [Colwellia polaris]|jgi:large subunit ribosomal protein L32e
MKNREDKHKKSKLKNTSWRRPTGKHSRARLEKKGAVKLPKVGRRTAKSQRGLHPSGYEEKLVNRPADLDDIDSETEAARVASTVGGRKKAQIIEKAEEQDIKVLNSGDQE